jgi:hypothetical protein
MVLKESKKEKKSKKIARPFFFCVPFHLQRKLNLRDLLSRSEHYSPKIRKDAYVGLKDLFEKFPTLLLTVCTTTSVVYSHF